MPYVPYLFDPSSIHYNFDLSSIHYNFDPSSIRYNIHNTHPRKQKGNLTRNILGQGSLKNKIQNIEYTVGSLYRANNSTRMIILG